MIVKAKCCSMDAKGMFTPKNDSGPGKFSLKVILVGSCGVGKTSLISTYFKKQFSEQSMTTIAPASSNTIITMANGDSVSLQIWDTAGQERFQSISQMFYRGSDICFVCYDQNNVESISQWIDRVKSETPDCIFFIIATKADLLGPDDLIRAETDGRNICQKNGAKLHFITSAMDGRNIDELFQAAAMCAYDVRKPSIPNPALKLESKSKKSKGCC